MTMKTVKDASGDINILIAIAPSVQKRATLTACLKKVHQMASDPDELYRSALDKCAEFSRLGYPHGVLRNACSYLGASTGEGRWITVRNALE